MILLLHKLVMYSEQSSSVQCFLTDISCGVVSSV